MRLVWANQTLRICLLKKLLAFMKHHLYVCKLEGNEVLTSETWPQSPPCLPSAWHLVLLWLIPTIPHRVNMILLHGLQQEASLLTYPRPLKGEWLSQVLVL